MTTRKRKRMTKKARSLKARDVSAGKAREVRGGSWNVGMKYGPTQKIQDRRNIVVS